jgi:ubiquinone/menaquinone biosynthesis C-methylase UbiE
MKRVTRGLLAGLLGYLAVGYWMRRHPSAMPYAQRFFVELPHPAITRGRLREVLEPRPGEQMLEVGPGTGYYTLDLADWVGPGGAVEILDLQQEFLDHTMRRARDRGLTNVNPTRGDAQELPYDTDRFDAAVLVSVLGEIPDQGKALGELRRVLKPGARLVVGELFPPDPHMVMFGALRARAEGAGLRFERRLGPAFGYFARFRA